MAGIIKKKILAETHHTIIIFTGKMVGKRQLRNRNCVENLAENEKTGLLAKRARTRANNSAKTADDIKSTEKKQTDSSTKRHVTSGNKNSVRNSRLVSKEKLNTCDMKNGCFQDSGDEMDKKGTPCEGPEVQSCKTRQSLDCDVDDKFLKELSQCGLQKRLQPIEKEYYKPKADTSRNLIHVLQNFSYGLKCRVQVQEVNILLFNKTCTYSFSFISGFVVN
jgi:hypothetical protein